MTSNRRLIYAYETLTLGSLLHAGSNTVEFNGHLFRYVWTNDSGSTETILHRNATSCRSITLIAIAKTSDGSDPASTLDVVQETADPVSVGIPPNTQRTITAKLSGNAFTAESTDETTAGGLYGNGSASCWSLNGSSSQ